MGFIKNFLFGSIKDPHLEIAEDRIRDLKFKIGELSSQILINKTKGIDYSDLTPIYQETVHNTIFRLQEFKDLIKYQLEVIKDASEIKKINYKLDLIDKDIEKLKSNLEI